MKKGIKTRLISFLLMTVMVISCLAGCGKKEDVSNDKEPIIGGFVESEISLPEGVNQLIDLDVSDDGIIYALAVTGGGEEAYRLIQLESSDYGENWKESDMKIDSKVSTITAWAMTNDGTLALVEVDDEFNSTLMMIKNGKTESVELSLPKCELTGDSSENSLNLVFQLCYSNDGKLYCLDYNSNVLLIDEKTGKTKNINALNGDSIEVLNAIDGSLYMIDSNKVVLYDDGTETEIDTLSEFFAANSIVQDGQLYALGAPAVLGKGYEEDTMIVATAAGIYLYDKNGCVMEQIVDGSITSLTSGTTGFIDIVMPDKDNIFVSTICGNDVRLYRYSYDDNASLRPEKEIVVYSLYDSTYLKSVAADYHSKNPDVLVTIQTGMTGDDSVTEEDAIKALNTDILAGNGPDIVLLDGLPSDSYIEKNVLVDISDVIDEIKESDGLYENVYNNYVKDGKCYCFPARMTFVIGASTKDSIDEMKSFAALKDASASHKGSIPYLGKRTAENIMSIVYAAKSNMILNEDRSLNEEGLVKMLNYAKDLYDACDKKGEMSPYGELNLGTDDIYSGMKMSTITLFTALAKYESVEFGSVADLQIPWLKDIVNNSKNDIEVAVLGCDDEGSTQFVPWQTFGVLDGNNVDISKDFVKMALSKEKNSEYSNGIPTNIAGTDKALETFEDKQILDAAVTMVQDRDGNSIEIELCLITKETEKAFKEMIESLEKAGLSDVSIQNIITEQGAQYIAGKLSIEECVDNIKSKVELYLSEQN